MMMELISMSMIVGLEMGTSDPKRNLNIYCTCLKVHHTEMKLIEKEQIIPKLGKEVAQKKKISQKNNSNDNNKNPEKAKTYDLGINSA
ncbi:hypothetical protein J0S82_001184 [Galemys pyrenaicus]|uniref:Uncharacterized protein n=1 Tax=Galemys pyrenaicus TaxID=202257 RepID=A0A8J5ZPN4_GALPY|nr:hypothetical protein J0S82_001184 [Galemys pyrenaicus]